MKRGARGIQSIEQKRIAKGRRMTSMTVFLEVDQRSQILRTLAAAHPDRTTALLRLLGDASLKKRRTAEKTRRGGRS